MGLSSRAALLTGGSAEGLSCTETEMERLLLMLAFPETEELSFTEGLLASNWRFWLCWKVEASLRSWRWALACLSSF